MKRILVPTDFSDCAANAITAATGLAGLFDSEIFLLHADEGLGPVYTDYMGANKEFETQQRLNSLQSLRDLRQKLVAEGNKVAEVMEKTGSVKDAVKAAIEEKSIDLVVMGTEGAGRSGHRRWGSNTAAVTGNSTVPVLIIPDQYAWSLPSRMLVASNHFEDRGPEMETILRMAAAFMATVEVVVFSDTEVNDPVEMMEHGREIKWFESRLHELYGNRISQASHISGEGFIKTLNEEVENRHIDMLVMITYQRSFLERLFHPSETRKMTYRTRVPLLVIPAGQK